MLKCIDAYVIKASNTKFLNQMIVEPIPYNGVTIDRKWLYLL